MKFIISSSGLLAGMMTVAKAIPSKSSLPILENFLFDLQGDVLEITAFDSEIMMRTRVSVESVEEEGRIAVPARHMLELLKELPDQPVSIGTVKDNYFECRWNGGQSTLPYFQAAEYPEITTVDKESATTVEFPAEILAEGIGSTVFATDDDQMRPVMNGIFFDMSDAGITLVASDSRKLVCYTSTKVKTANPAGFILHKKPASIIRSAIDKENGNVSICYDGKNAMFTFAGTMMVCRLIVGKYPRYRDVIPQNSSNVLKIDRLQFLNCVKRVSVCASKATNHIKLETGNGSSMRVSAQDLGFSIEAFEDVPCQYDGDGLQIGFKSNFLADILSNMTSDEVVVKFSDPRRAALLLPVEEEADTRFCAILMPIQI